MWKFVKERKNVEDIRWKEVDECKDEDCQRTLRKQIHLKGRNEPGR